MFLWFWEAGLLGPGGRVCMEGVGRVLEVGWGRVSQGPGHQGIGDRGALFRAVVPRGSGACLLSLRAF